MNLESQQRIAGGRRKVVEVQPTPASWTTRAGRGSFVASFQMRIVESTGADMEGEPTAADRLSALELFEIDVDSGMQKLPKRCFQPNGLEEPDDIPFLAPGRFQ